MAMVDGTDCSCLAQDRGGDGAATTGGAPLPQRQRGGTKGRSRSTSAEERGGAPTAMQPAGDGGGAARWRCGGRMCCSPTTMTRAAQLDRRGRGGVRPPVVCLWLRRRFTPPDLLRSHGFARKGIGGGGAGVDGDVPAGATRTAVLAADPGDDSEVGPLLLCLDATRGGWVWIRGGCSPRRRSAWVISPGAPQAAEGGERGRGRRKRRLRREGKP
jgi:hypothetical protein